MIILLYRSRRKRHVCTAVDVCSVPYFEAMEQFPIHSVDGKPTDTPFHHLINQLHCYIWSCTHHCCIALILQVCFFQQFYIPKADYMALRLSFITVSFMAASWIFFNGSIQVQFDSKVVEFVCECRHIIWRTRMISMRTWFGLWRMSSRASSASGTQIPDLDLVKCGKSQDVNKQDLE